MGKVKEQDGPVLTLLRRNERTESKIGLQARAIGLAQGLRDKLLAATEAEHPQRILQHERTAQDYADQLAALMGALRDYE